MKQLFAKVAVQIVAVNLIWPFVGVFCAMCVSRSVVSVCVWMYVTDTVDDVLCCPFIHALPRDLFVQQVNVASNGLGTEGGKALADCLKTNTTITQVRRFVARPCVVHAVLLHCAAVLRCCAPLGGVSVDVSHAQYCLPKKRFRLLLPALSVRLWACFV